MSRDKKKVLVALKLMDLSIVVAHPSMTIVEGSCQ